MGGREVCCCDNFILLFYYEEPLYGWSFSLEILVQEMRQENHEVTATTTSFEDGQLLDGFMLYAFAMAILSVLWPN